MSNTLETPGSKYKKVKIFCGAILLLLALVGIAVYFTQPKTTIVMAVPPNAIDKDGKLIYYKSLQKALADDGVTLILRTQNKDEVEIHPLESVIKDNSIDFVFAPNTGATLPEEVGERFRSLGVVTKVPLFLLKKNSAPNINYLKDLRGKKLAFYARTVSKEAPAFTDGGVTSSPYSSEYIVENLFKALDIDAKNTVFINTNPNNALTSSEADYYLGWSDPKYIGGIQNVTNNILSNKLKFVTPKDIHGVGSKVSGLNSGVMETSTLSMPNAIPEEPMPYLYATASAIVRKDMDPSLVMFLSEAIQKEFSPQNSFRKKNEFPNFETTELFQPHQIAVDYYKNGKPFLANYVSPTISALIIKLLIILIPIASIIWPLTSLIPKIYSVYAKHKITHWYVDLELIDKAYRTSDPQARKHYRETIERIRQEVTDLRLPVMHTHFSQELFAARIHIELIQRRIDEIDRKSNL